MSNKYITDSTSKMFHLKISQNCFIMATMTIIVRYKYLIHKIYSLSIRDKYNFNATYVQACTNMYILYALVAVLWLMPYPWNEKWHVDLSCGKRSFFNCKIKSQLCQRVAADCFPILEFCVKNLARPELSWFYHSCVNLVLNHSELWIWLIKHWSRKYIYILFFTDWPIRGKILKMTFMDLVESCHFRTYNYKYIRH